MLGLAISSALADAVATVAVKVTFVESVKITPSGPNKVDVETNGNQPITIVVEEDTVTVVFE